MVGVFRAAATKAVGRWWLRGSRAETRSDSATAPVLAGPRTGLRRASSVDRLIRGEGGCWRRWWSASIACHPVVVVVVEEDEVPAPPPGSSFRQALSAACVLACDWPPVAAGSRRDSGGRPGTGRTRRCSLGRLAPAGGVPPPKPGPPPAPAVREEAAAGAERRLEGGGAAGVRVGGIDPVLLQAVLELRERGVVGCSRRRRRPEAAAEAPGGAKAGAGGERLLLRSG